MPGCRPPSLSQGAVATPDGGAYIVEMIGACCSDQPQDGNMGLINHTPSSEHLQPQRQRDFRPVAMAEITPEYVLSLQEPAKGYLCSMDKNPGRSRMRMICNPGRIPFFLDSFNPGIEFLRFEIKDFNSGRIVYSVSFCMMLPPVKPP
jgi:hypothetical protein